MLISLSRLTFSSSGPFFGPFLPPPEMVGLTALEATLLSLAPLLGGKGIVCLAPPALVFPHYRKITSGAVLSMVFF